VTAAAEADTLIGVRLAHLDGQASGGDDGHANLRAYLDRWRSEAGEFFGREGFGV
jgi:hypothetical protein